MIWKDKRYHSLNYYLQNKYGHKLYRLSLDAGMTCPNRDGSLGSKGCIFCSLGGSGDFAANRSLSITEQLEQEITRMEKKCVCESYIAYFQAFTNTYAPISYLRSCYEQALHHPKVSILSIATRPDCLSSEVLDLLEECNLQKPVWVELGLQTIHPSSAEFIRRGFDLSIFEEALSNLRSRNIEVIVHVILGLPTETTKDMLETIRYLSKKDIQGIKLHLLHVLEHTDLATEYQKNPFPVFTLDEYANLICDCIELLPPEVVIHRLTGDGAKKDLIAPLWSGNKKLVLNTINQTFTTRNTYQGRLYSGD